MLVGDQEYATIAETSIPLASFPVVGSTLHDATLRCCRRDDSLFRPGAKWKVEEGRT